MVSTLDNEWGQYPRFKARGKDRGLPHSGGMTHGGFPKMKGTFKGDIGVV